MNPPKIFISAASGDLGSARQTVKGALLTIKRHPVEQTNFEPTGAASLNLPRKALAWPRSVFPTARTSADELAGWYAATKVISHRHQI
ncbi:MAG: hypothetical protein B7Z37_30630 [Verrucomicrobia bacterium 12-59-8]|nr:MAG: hypothetical protein B7Z37_30630 [Verrucomicrobia bacterium 12-59-8]